MSLDLMTDDPNFVDVEKLRMEVGWYEVGRGLGRILLGYSMLLGSAAAGIGLMVLAFTKMNANSTKVNLGLEALVFIGAGIMMLVSPIAYGYIVAGHWRCLKSAPERHWSRWFIFSSITCVIMGPAINITCSVTGVTRYPQVRQGAHGLRAVEFSQTARYMQVVSNGVSVLSFVLFVAFLRSIARCFGDRGRVTHATLYLVFFLMLVGTTIAFLLALPRLIVRIEIIALLLAGWVVSFFWYLILIASIRWCITGGLQSLRGPLEG
jgi:hypothetical protein